VDHAALAELTAGRVLGGLDAVEERLVEAHVRGCRPCRALASELEAVLAELGTVAPRRAVPPALGPAILAAIAREAALGDTPPS
jgi:predicted anti-sigma-YlaC factor YlaD